MSCIGVSTGCITFIALLYGSFVDRIIASHERIQVSD